MTAALISLLIATSPMIEWYDECANGSQGNPDGSWCIYTAGDGESRYLFPGWFNE